MNTATADISDIIQVAQDPINQTEDKAIVTSSFRDIVASVMNESQFSILNGKTPKHLIKRRPGKGGKTFSYVPHGYVTAKLNQAFGFDWDFEIAPNGRGDFYSVIEGEPEQSRNSSVIVHGKLTVRIRDPQNLTSVIATISKSSTGEKEIMKGMSWGGLIKSAESDAFKKCASRLGIALDLYWQDTDEDYISPEDKEKELISKVAALVAQGKTKPEVAAELNLTIPQVIAYSKNGSKG